MRTYAQGLAYAESQRLHPSTYVQQGNHCQMFSRQCVGASAWAESALKAWQATPAAHRHPISTARAGSLAYFWYPGKGNNQNGHVVYVTTGGMCYSTDILGMGKVYKVPLSLIHQRWGMTPLGWIDSTPSGAINLAPLPAPAPTVVVRLADLSGSRAILPSKSAYTVNKALVAEGSLKPTLLRSFWGPASKTSFINWRNAHGFTASENHAAFVALGKRRGFTVV